MFEVLTLEGWLDIRDMLSDEMDATTWVRNKEEEEEEEGGGRRSLRERRRRGRRKEALLIVCS